MKLRRIGASRVCGCIFSLDFIAIGGILPLAAPRTVAIFAQAEVEESPDTTGQRAP